MDFYLGLHKPFQARYIDEPVFISVRRLKDRVSRIEIDQEWMMDSGGFTELSLHGEYRMTAQEYADIIRKHKPPVAFCQDWMCEPEMLEKTGLTIEEHQRRTCESYIELKELLADEEDVEIAPVLQGWTPEDYYRHIEMYWEEYGVDLDLCFVGIGTLCCRKKVDDIWWIVAGIRTRLPYGVLHAFGLKTDALKNLDIYRWLDTADSMAWSYWARKHGKNQNSAVVAVEWLNNLSARTWMPTREVGMAQGYHERGRSKELMEEYGINYFDHYDH